MKKLTGKGLTRGPTSGPESHQLGTATATLELHTPQAEPHLSQLAKFENYAPHALRVQFTSGEATALEQHALEVALKESRDMERNGRKRAGARGSQVSPGLTHKTLTEKEALDVIRRTTSEEREAQGLQRVQSQLSMDSSEDPSRKTKTKASLAAFFGRKADPVVQLADAPPRDEAAEREEAAQRERSREAEKRAAKERASNETLKHVRGAREGASMNVPSTPSNTDSDETRARLSRGVTPSQLTEAATALVAERGKASAKGIELGYDEVLRDARKLRKDLESLSKRCTAKVSEHQKRVNTLQGKKKKPAEQELTAALSALEAAEVRSEAVAEGIEEVVGLERFIKAARPPKFQASGLSKEVIRQLLACLNHLGLGLTSPGSGSGPPGVAIQKLVARFRTYSVNGGVVPPADDDEGGTPMSEPAAPPGAVVSIAPDTPPVKAPQPSPPSPPSPALAPFPMPTIAPLRSGRTPVPLQLTELPPIAPPLISTQGSFHLLRSREDGGETESVALGTPGSSSEGRRRRVFGRTRSQNGRGLEGSERSSPRAPCPTPRGLKRNPQVVSLFNELKRELGSELMDVTWVEPHTSAAKRAALYDPVSMTPEELYDAKAEARQHAPVITMLAREIEGFTTSSMSGVVDFVTDAGARLAVIMADEAAVLAQFPDWPKGKWDALREAAEAVTDMAESARRERTWLLQRGTCEDEIRRIEVFFDSTRDRTETLAGNAETLERQLILQGIPWDNGIFTPVRQNCLHLATLYMSRVLFEVASLERSSTLQHESCLGLLAGAVRAAHKTHTFAGGFTPECNELFDKVRRLARYYLRVIDPTWLKGGGSQLKASPYHPPSSPLGDAGSPLASHAVALTD